MSELFLQNEDNLNTLIVNFNKLIKNFSLLSRDKIENALITANSMMKEGENNIKIMEEEINKLNLQQQLGTKLSNYKLEFQNLQLKFKDSKDKYINQKANNAINLGNEDENINDENKKTQVITDISNNLKSEVENNLKSSYSGNENNNNINNNSEIVEKVQIQEKLTSDNLNNSLPDIDLNIGNKRRNKKLIIVLIVIAIFIIVFLIGFLTLYLTKDNKNNRNNNPK